MDWKKEEKMKKKRRFAYFQLVMIFTSLFSFTFMAAESLVYFDRNSYGGGSFGLGGIILDKLREPMVPLVSADDAESSPSVCCERTREGAVCVNAPEDQCDPSALISSTSCETTSYCKLGTCYDSSEGVCMGNTPESICDASGGEWDVREVDQVPQCQLGCCIIGDQASFVSLTRCKKLSTFYGVPNDYRTDIDSESLCIAEAQAQDKGACVYEVEFERVCEFTTRGECNEEENPDKTFYEDRLCSAEELGTTCARAADTTCYQGDVYYLDSCGNRENVYSTNVDLSWNGGRILEPEEVCSPNDGSNRECGNCDYFLGTRCSPDEGLLGGDHYCKLTECYDREGNPRINGESWCVYDGTVGDSQDPAGSRHYREVCIDGEVVVEACADFRNEVCVSNIVDTSAGEFEASICRVNRWQDCSFQDEAEDCLDDSYRDCNWVNGFTGLALGDATGGSGQTVGFSNPTSGGNSFNNPTAQNSFTGNVIAPITGNAIAVEDVEGGESQTDRPDGVCVPNIPPGLKFWEGNAATTICSQASAECIVRYEKGLLGGGWQVVEGEECLEEEWANRANRVCTALGDCGANVNFVGEFTDDGFEWAEDGEKKELTRNQINVITGGFRGLSILSLAASFFLLMVEDFSFVSADRALSTAPNPSRHMRNDADVGLENAGEGGGLGDSLPFGLGALAKHELVKAVGYAGLAFGIGQLLGGIIGLDENNRLALSTALAGGVFVGKGAAHLANKGTFGFDKLAAKVGGNSNLGIISGVGVGVLLFLIMFKKTKEVTITAECMPWQAPTGASADVCESCNEDELPCSEYRCRSLGANCALVNEGTEDELCISTHVDDSLPPVIRPDNDELTVGLEYTDVRNSPPGPGFKITDPASSTGDGCLKAYSAIQFGIETNEPSQCRIDFESKPDFDSMRNFMGMSNVFSYEHQESLVVPSMEALRNSSIVLQNGEELNLFIRCQDQAGNVNEAEYAVRVCVDDAPDTTPPEIEETSILEDGCVAEDVTEASVEFYLNEPSQCRWSFFDQDYDDMTEEMNCIDRPNLGNTFTCSTDLDGIARDGTDYYVRCKDQPYAPEGDRNKMSESYIFSLRGSTGLRLGNLRPNGTIFGGLSPMPVELYAETTFGCYDGRAVCFYSDDGGDNFIQFLDTNTGDGVHTQRQDLVAGDYEYIIQCVDAGGNIVEDTTEFTVEIDEHAPDIARIYEEGGKLKIVTVRDSECSYTTNSCDFTFAEGNLMTNIGFATHLADWNEEDTYYIKCIDEFENENAECSAVVKPSKIY